jgi:hypothetical protein
MKITYYAIALAATIFSRVVVAQTETPTPSPNPSLETDSATVRQPTADLKKKPRPVYESGQPKFQHLTPTTPTPFRPRPDTTLRRPYKPAIPKKPTYRPQPDTTLKPPPYRPRPDTTSRINPTPVPDTPFDPFAGVHHPAVSNRRTFTFPNGEHVEIETLGDDVAFTYPNGHRRVEHKHDVDHKPTGAHPSIDCEGIFNLLTHTNPNSRWWRRMCIKYINGC